MCLKTNEYISSVIASGKFANVADLIEFAKSNNHKEAFIIGNSTGLRQITDEQWERVRNGFSIGFNGIPLFENFAPNVWMFEISNFWLSHIAQDIFKQAETRLDCVENFFLIKDTFCTEINACKAVISFTDKIKRAKVAIIPQDIFVEGNAVKVVKENYKRLFENCKSNPDYLVRKRGSVTMGLFLLLIAGFKRINFIGVDLTNNSHFYEESDNKNVHLTENPSFGLPISDVISAMIQAFNEISSDKVEVFAASGRLLDKNIAKQLDW
jgi:hypothetical protein